jgi:ribosomal protein L11 methyltransferase
LPQSAPTNSSEAEPSAFLPTLLIANINRNILLADMPRFASCLSPGGELLLSGFYTEDVPVLLAEAEKHDLHSILQRQDANWSLLLLKKGKSS